MLLSLLVSTITLFHPLHISVTEIAFDEKEKELEIVSRIFIDDLETAIRAQRNEPDLNLPEPVNNLTTDELIKKYITTHFKISLDGKPQQVKYLGHETEESAFICYIQVSNVKKWKTIEVFNDIITEVYDDQSNLVHVTLSGTVRSLRLTKDNSKGTIVF